MFLSPSDATTVLQQGKNRGRCNGRGSISCSGEPAEHAAKTARKCEVIERIRLSHDRIEFSPALVLGNALHVTRVEYSLISRKSKLARTINSFSMDILLVNNNNYCKKVKGYDFEFCTGRHCILN